jgi:hypothetical protein
MADIVYYANTMDANGELHLRLVEEPVNDQPATLKVQQIKDEPRGIDVTLIAFHEPKCRDEGDK